MNDNKAPKLDPEKIVLAIAELMNNGDSSFMDFGYHSANTNNNYEKTVLYSAFLKVKTYLKKKGKYKYFQPLFSVVSRIAPSRYKTVRVLSLSQFTMHNGIFFLENAYRTLLQREPDQSGLLYYKEKMINGEKSKIDVLGEILASPEGRKYHIKLKGFQTKYTIRKWLRKLYKIPVFGYIIHIAVRIILLPKTIQTLYGDTVLVHDQLEYAKIENSLLKEYINNIDIKLSNEVSMQKSILFQQEYKSARHEDIIAQQEDKIVLQKEILTQQTTDILQLRKQFDKTLEVGIGPDDSVYIALEDRFRGSKEDIKDRLHVYYKYIELLSETSDSLVLDIGCGRGEWLELLRDNKVTARGVDFNNHMVNTCINNGLDVHCDDCVHFLENTPVGMYHAITGMQVIEHIPFKTMFHLFQLCHRALKPNGFVLFETPNLNNLLVAAKTFHSDPTHINKLTPDVIKFYLEQAGFSQVEIFQYFARKDPAYTDNNDINEIIYFINMEQDCSIVGYKR